MKCTHDRISLSCADCDATWSDPRRGANMLLGLMGRSHVLKHNLQDILKELSTYDYLYNFYTGQDVI